MKKSLIHFTGYAASILIASLLLMLVLNLGSQGGHSLIGFSAVNENASNWFQLSQQELSRNLNIPLVGLLIQILVILVFSRVCSFVLKYLGQPQVIGEMIAGILLGKSVLAIIWPSGFEALFPESSLQRLYFLSQIGLIFFMFVVGLDLKVSDLKNRAAAAVLVSHVSILVPFLLGATLALGLYDKYGPPNTPFYAFALFMGISMSITAFPVLARIIQEKRLTNTPLGTMAITCAAIDDVTAWCVLAAILGIVKAGSISTAITVLTMSLIYVVIMLKVVKPFILKVLQPSLADNQSDPLSTKKLTRGQVSMVFSILLGSALVSEAIGIHALFGAFLAGVIMPTNILFRTSISEKIEDLSGVVLLPIFFAYTGIRTQINLLNDWGSWAVCGGIIALAVIGKLVGSAFAARWSGMNWRESWALGSLMNTRGLMELIVLNIGYDLGILSPTVFAMLVVMAIITTTMTGPMLSLCLPEFRMHSRKR